ncbi:hypothetical protein ACXA45_06995 [Neomicrococcus lactis]
MQPEQISIDLLDAFGSNPPLVNIPDHGRFQPKPLPMNTAARFRSDLGSSTFLDSLLVAKESDLLVVGLHGALNQEKTKLPRFERMSTILNYPVNSMFFGDPALWMSPSLQLSWYTGWNGIDLQRTIADWSLAAAKAVGAKKLLFTGSSGGGFAALQISSLVANSYALVFNAQTDIANYRINGEGYGAQRTYVKTVWPEIAATFNSHTDIESGTWADSLGGRASAVKRYSEPTENYVFIVQNAEEFHFEDHYLPFLEAAKRGGNIARVKMKTYLDGPVHAQPKAQTFTENFEEALIWIKDLPNTISES